MAYRRLEPAAWKPYFTDMAKRLHASHVDVRVDALDLGDQLEVDHAALQGLDYDSRDGCIELSFEHLDHRICDIGEIWVDEREGQLHAMCVTRRDGRLEVVEFEPVMEIAARPRRGAPPPPA